MVACCSTSAPVNGQQGRRLQRRKADPGQDCGGQGDASPTRRGTARCDDCQSVTQVAALGGERGGGRREIVGETEVGSKAKHERSTVSRGLRWTGGQGRRSIWSSLPSSASRHLPLHRHTTRWTSPFTICPQSPHVDTAACRVTFSYASHVRHPLLPAREWPRVSPLASLQWPTHDHPMPHLIPDSVLH